MATHARSAQRRRLDRRHGPSLAWPVVGAVVFAAGLGVLVDRVVAPQLAPSRESAFQRVLNGLVSGPHRIAPGVTAYLAGPHGVLIGSAGVEDAETGAPMPNNARVRLNSVGKMWTATLILKLAGEGKMRLTDTVAHWLPGLLPYGNQITVLQLMSMTSGMIDTNDFYARPAYYISRIKNPTLRAIVLAAGRRARTDPAYPTTREWIDAAAGVGLLYEPGSTYHYSNIGYMVAGLIAAEAGGADLATQFRQQIIDPLHLTSARYDPAPNITGPHAHGYSISPKGKLTDATTWTSGLAANGGIVSDAADEAHFLQALVRGEILKPAELTALETPWSVADDYGLGVVIQPDGCATPGTAYGHNGGGGGYQSSVQVSTDGSRVAVVLINGYPTSVAAQDHENTVLFNTMQTLYCGG